MGPYVATVDDLLRRPVVPAPTLGLLLVTGRSEQKVRCALTASSAPVAVADWSALPADARAVLPPPERTAAALDTPPSPAAARAADPMSSRGGGGHRPGPVVVRSVLGPLGTLAAQQAVDLTAR